jgi:hypothetical protein
MPSPRRQISPTWTLRTCRSASSCKRRGHRTAIHLARARHKRQPAQGPGKGDGTVQGPPGHGRRRAPVTSLATWRGSIGPLVGGLVVWAKAVSSAEPRPRCLRSRPYQRLLRWPAAPPTTTTRFGPWLLSRWTFSGRVVQRRQPVTGARTVEVQAGDVGEASRQTVCKSVGPFPLRDVFKECEDLRKRVRAIGRLCVFDRLPSPGGGLLSS